MLNHASSRIVLCILGLLAVGIAGCQVVHVKDTQGDPVFWADVATSVQGQKDNPFPVKTDLLGNATLMMSQEPSGTAEYITVRKEGYLPAKIVRPEGGTAEVTLRAAPNAQKKK
jgi:hypothetical protein